VLFSLSSTLSPTHIHTSTEGAPLINLSVWCGICLFQVRDAVWSLSLQSAGIQVGFATNSANLFINYTTADMWEPMVHFSVSGVSGVDLWAFDDLSGTYRFVAAANLAFGTSAVVVVFIRCSGSRTRALGTRQCQVQVLVCVFDEPCYSDFPPPHLPPRS
jgi:hypothetical protein